MKEIEIQVGILSSLRIEFSLNGFYTAKGETVSGPQTAVFDEGGIRWQDEVYHDLTFRPTEESASFTLTNVKIGIDYHWERHETQSFRGVIRLIVNEAKILVINKLPVEEYLTSVISSEMNATSSLEFLKAHAVISRSWVLAQIERRKQNQEKDQGFFSFVKTEDSYIRWYDREDHTLFDVCADDHCQRYQGINRVTNPAVIEAVKATRGQVLTHDHEICNARFSKCCGGATELFSTCWEDKDLPYLKGISDTEEEDALPDLTQEAEAGKWIRTSPKSFCNTKDEHVLSQILNNYDQETTDFYRWKVHYSQAELADLIRRRTKTDYGDIIDLIPVERGTSGRLSKLKIVGTLHTLIIGKELEIRRTLSESHLFSSAFVVDKGPIENEVPAWFDIIGAGWGHGVGLCQIGAAVMGENGYTYDAILAHYYKDAIIEKLYD